MVNIREKTGVGHRRVWIREERTPLLIGNPLL